MLPLEAVLETLQLIPELNPTSGARVCLRIGRRRARAFRVAALNSGMWYVSATEASRRLMGKLICIYSLRMGNWFDVVFCVQVTRLNAPV